MKLGTPHPLALASPLVRGVNEGERELGEGSQVMEGRADGWGRG